MKLSGAEGELDRGLQELQWPEPARGGTAQDQKPRDPTRTLKMKALRSLQLARFRMHRVVGGFLVLHRLGSLGCFRIQHRFGIWSVLSLRLERATRLQDRHAEEYGQG